MQQPAWLDGIIAWIAAHPVLAGGAIFLIAFCDALAVIGIVVPALPLLFAVGTLIGLNYLSGPYAVACAAAGAFCGDALSYWIGHRWGAQLREHWLFRRYPQLLDRGERLFRRHGAKGIVIARFVGAVRPFVPAVAGMLQLPLRRYVPASAFAALAWAALFLAPGWLFGASYDAVAAVADRLALALLGLLGVVALAWACVVYTWRWFADHADRLLARLLAWTRAHPHLGRYAAALVDPNRPESASLAVLAACLFAVAWLMFALVGALLLHGAPLAFDDSVQATMRALRNPLTDRLLAPLSTLGDANALVPAVLVVLAFLLWRRRWIAAAHWLAAPAVALLLSAGLRLLVRMPAPQNAAAGFAFPAWQLTLATVVLGFFAVLIAREWPGRRRVWPYLIGAVLVALLGFARLYFGLHWASDIIGSVLLGIAWLLLIGIAYRRHVARSFWIKPLVLLFYGSFVAAASWHALHADTAPLRSAHDTPSLALPTRAWWRQDWQRLPQQRDAVAANGRWLLDVQVAGPLAPLQQQLQARGWRVQTQADWTHTLALLDGALAPTRQPILPATFDTQPEALLLRHDRADGSADILRLWRAPARLDDGTPLWLGSTQRLRYTRRLRVFGLWQPSSDNGAAHADVRTALSALRSRDAARPGTHTPVLLVRTDQGISASN